MNLLAPLLLLGAVAAFCAAIYFLSVSLAELRRLLPPEFQEHEVSRYAIDTFIWQASIPARTRLKYVLGLAFASAAVGSMAVLMTLHGSMLTAALFGVVFLFMAGVTLTRWIRYRALR